MWVVGSDDGVWVPEHARAERAAPQVGWLVGFEHAVWRVLELLKHVDGQPFPDWYMGMLREFVSLGPPLLARMRRVGPGVPDVVDPAALDTDRWVGCVVGRTEWWVFRDEHFPLCARCGEPPPCREEWSTRVAGRAIAALKPFELAGVCPSCKQPVSSRQESITYDDNVVLLGGPPVTFHLRRGCAGAAVLFDERWVAADPAHRVSRVVCPGAVTNHGDGTYDCSAGVECRGPTMRHTGGWQRCECPDCHARGRFGCMPGRRSRLRATM